MNNDFKPIINTKSHRNNSLNQKNVEIKGKVDFSRNTHQHSTNIPQITTIDNKKELESHAIDKRFKATLTQKISPSVNLKLNTLKPFLGELENMSKPTINEIIDLIIDSYVNSRLTTRQQEAFKSMYDTQLNMIKK
ncbi:hypothetical protein ACS8GA_002841 [Enterococcus hirae]|nr:hypothetical protein [Enterococcus hirae]EMF0520182.1 hypothetical protein [Enterococcus hirae]